MRLVDGIETNILRVSPVNIWDEVDTKIAIRLLLVLVSNFLRLIFPSSNSLANSLCNKRHELAENFLSLILINLVPKVASNCE